MAVVVDPRIELFGMILLLGGCRGFWPVWGRWHSSVTDQSYPGWELWAEPKIGYMFHFTLRASVPRFSRRSARSRPASPVP